MIIHEFFHAFEMQIGMNKLIWLSHFSTAKNEKCMQIINKLLWKASNHTVIILMIIIIIIIIITIIIIFSLCLNMAVTNCCGIAVRKQIVKLRLGAQWFSDQWQGREMLSHYRCSWRKEGLSAKENEKAEKFQI